MFQLSLTDRTYYAHPGSVDGNNVLDGSIALGLVQAVSAGLVEGTEGVCDESGDVVLAAKRVILEDLVRVRGCGSFNFETARTLSWALRAPPPMTRSWVFRPFEVRASSQTSSHHTCSI